MNTFGGVAEGAEAYALAQLAQGALIYVAASDREMVQIASTLPFFVGGKTILTFPAWDTLPYDRTSPNHAIVSERLNTLSTLAHGVDSPVVITTVAAITQRLMPRELAAQSRFHLTKGAPLNHAAFMQFLENAGYRRAGKAMESGEYAVRGSMIDIIPSGHEQGCRIDLFGDDIETIRTFDPFTQRSSEEVSGLTLEAASEIWLTAETIERFRSNYRDHFGAQQGNALYEAISGGMRVPGAEYFLPLFYTHTHTLLDYAPKATLVLTANANALFDARAALIADYFDARKTADIKHKQDAYRPLPPEALYLPQAALTNENTRVFSPFAADSHVGTQAHLFATGGNPYEALKTLSATQRIILAASTRGAAERLFVNLSERSIAAVKIAHISEGEALDAGMIGVAHLPLSKGFSISPPPLMGEGQGGGGALGSHTHLHPTLPLAPSHQGRGNFFLITEAELLGVRIAERGKSKQKTDVFLQEAAMFIPGELVVHAEHGIGRFDALETVTVLGAAHDCLKIVYENDDKLFVPVENMDVLSRFGSEDEGVKLDKLGAAQWQMRKAKMKERIKIAAEALIKTAAERAAKEGTPIQGDLGAMDEFARGFGFVETEDQARAIDDVLTDLAAGKPMDRLVCGDVGFGKTEVALRAAFAAVSSSPHSGGGLQVAIVVPTSLLARQHAALFSKRFAPFPIRVAQLSRMVDAKTQKAVKEGLADGSVDIVIGTHALLAKTIEFKRLGLVIVDEEQHFGVKQKERLKQLKTDVHVLTLTATPIPRTLQLALSGVRELSLITTPPVDRLAVRSFVMPFDPVSLREALLREKHRGGRSFIVTPRIADMADLLKTMQELMPELSFATAHGQLSAEALEEVMGKFYDGAVDVLLATNIIESGLDVQTANTIIINRADRFGLSQLYQMRGRVGRGKQRAYAYFLIPSYTITHQAMRRLEVMQTLDRLGAGFTLASHDMDIRGFGNLVGEEQSGHIREVGVELYQHMLEEAIAELRNSSTTPLRVEEWSPQLNLGISVLIPETYVADLELRMGLYKRAASMKTPEEVEALHAEMIDRFGALPLEVENLLNTVRMKQLCVKAAIARLDAGPKGAVITFKSTAVASPEKLLQFIAKHPTRLKLKPDQTLIYLDDFRDKTQTLATLTPFIHQLTAAVG